MFGMHTNLLSPREKEKPTTQTIVCCIMTQQRLADMLDATPAFDVSLLTSEPSINLSGPDRAYSKLPHKPEGRSQQRDHR